MQGCQQQQVYYPEPWIDVYKRQEPIRVSAGLAVTGLSGKILIQTLPPRLM